MSFSFFKKKSATSERLPGQVAVLFVCTGNICRSPTAEGILRHKLDAAGLSDKVLVDSAGLIDYHSGRPPDPQGQEQARLRGYDLSDLRARRFKKQDFHDFDLIVCMDRGHHMQLLTRCPDGNADRLRLFMEYLPAGTLQGHEALDVPDPYDGEIEDFELVLDLVEPGVEALIEEIKKDHL